MKRCEIKYACDCRERFEWKRLRVAIKYGGWSFHVPNNISKCKVHGAPRSAILVTCDKCDKWFTVEDRHYKYCIKCYNEEFLKRRKELREEEELVKKEMEIIDKIFEEL